MKPGGLGWNRGSLLHLQPVRQEGGNVWTLPALAAIVTLTETYWVHGHHAHPLQGPSSAFSYAVLWGYHILDTEEVTGRDEGKLNFNMISPPPPPPLPSLSSKLQTTFRAILVKGKRNFEGLDILKTQQQLMSKKVPMHT